MKTFCDVSFLLSAQFLALSASLAFCAKRALSLFSIAAHSSERHASLIADDSIVSTLLSYAAFKGAFQSQIPAEVC
jgi:hypothetical protein